jgi:hypothetical protein
MISKRIVSLSLGFTTAVVILCFFGCTADTTGPTKPLPNYLPQTFSLAIADGRASADGFAHNGIAVLTLDWNNDSPGVNAVGPKCVYNVYPNVDGGLSSDSDVWEQAPETILNLAGVYGDGGVEIVRIKSVYTSVNPARIWFLLRWEDEADGRQENSGYWGNHWEYIFSEGPADERWEPQWNDNEDWVAFMWDTWDKVPTDLNSDGNITEYEFVFEPRTPGFQENGCAVTCHDGRSHHTDSDREACDVWMFSGTRTNYTVNKSLWANGTDDPAFIFDLHVDEGGFNRGDSEKYPIPDEEWLVFDTGIIPYFANVSESEEYPEYGEPGKEAYLWYDEDIPGFDSDVERWSIGERIAGYVHRSAVGGTADVLGRGGWENGTWTVEIKRKIGTYDKINNSEDTLLGIFEAHPGE